MKKLLALVLIGFMSTAMAEAELKEKCIDVKDKDGKVVKDSKTGKPKQSCKTIKVHKKLEGTAVPEDKKKK